MKGTQPDGRSVDGTQGDDKWVRLRRLSDAVEVCRADLADRITMRDEAIWEMAQEGASVRRMARESELSFAHIQRIKQAADQAQNGIDLGAAA